MFKFEAEMVQAFEKALRSCQSPFDELDVGFEFNYLSGRVDVIGKTTDCELFSFEAKLTNWRRALDQAYRATSFSHYTYVVLPEIVALRVSKWDYDFTCRNVGLCSVGEHGVTIEIPATKCFPLQPWITNSALNFIS